MCVCVVRPALDDPLKESYDAAEMTESDQNPFMQCQSCNSGKYVLWVHPYLKGTNTLKRELFQSGTATPTVSLSFYFGW